MRYKHRQNRYRSATVAAQCAQDPTALEDRGAVLQTVIGHLGALSIYLVTIFLVVAAYSHLSVHWSPVGGFSEGLYEFEIPFVLLFSLLFFFPGIKRKSIKYLLPAIPIIALYLAVDIFYGFVSRSVRPSDFQNINMIFDVSGKMAFWVIAFFSVVACCVALLLYHAWKDYSVTPFFMSLGIKFSLIIFMALLLSSKIFAGFFEELYHETTWSQKTTITDNGKFASFIYYGRQERHNFTKLKNYALSSNLDVQSVLYPGTLTNHRNIHLIVLESFIDPRLLEGVRLSHDPLAPGLKRYLHDSKSFSKVISPVYGGQTAQAEFELLTGVRALGKVRSIEFNVMNGHKASSLVNRLKESGYRPLATIASNSGYFNSLQAYTSLGFDEILFLEEIPDFKKGEDDKKIFDGDLFEYNLKHIKKVLKENNGPIFNYVLGMYGHLWYERNLDERPDVVEVDHKGKHLHQVVNQFFYRTEALARYLNDLVSIDPDAIVYVTSDHLPPLLNKELSYKLDRYYNISLLLKAGKALPVDGKRYFEMPWLLWDLLSGGEHERSLQETDMENLYFQVLSESVGTR
jgi:phosphoglycerol transferase MdoB-like AlkP superfamily enzyme